MCTPVTGFLRQSPILCTFSLSGQVQLPDRVVMSYYHKNPPGNKINAGNLTPNRSTCADLKAADTVPSTKFILN